MPQTLDYLTPPAQHRWSAKSLKAANVVVLLGAMLCYVMIFGERGGRDAIVDGFPFVMFPYVINAALLFRWSTIVGQSLLLVASLAYAAWIAFIFIDQYLSPDPEALAFFWVGILAAPFLCILWRVAEYLDRRRRVA